MSDRMTAEANLLVACCRRFLRTDGAEHFGERTRGVDWGVVIQLADAHAVIPIVYPALKHETPSSIPEAAITEVAARFQANARNNLALTAELLKILALLAADRITAIPLKGPMLAFQAYGNLSLRTFSDLDLLVSRADVPRALRVLVANGYRMNWTLPSSNEAAYLKIKEQQLSFVQSNGTVAVDLHWRLVPDYFAAASEWEEALGRAQSVTFHGRSVPSLSPEDLLLFLCVHGGKHLWTRLGWICDVAGLIQSHPDINWSQMLAEAARRNAMRSVSVGLLLAAELLRVPLPEEAVRSMRSDPVACSLARDIQGRMFSQTPVGQTSLEACRFNLRITQGLTNKIRLFAAFVIRPGEAESRVLRLPSWLYPLYYPFRMARLAAKYAWPRR